MLSYSDAMEGLGVNIAAAFLRAALELPPDYFAQAFRMPSYTLRMSHYPRQEAVEDKRFGLAPHTDTSFMTMLAQNEIPGLSIRLPNGRWLDAPALPGSILVNGGDLLRRWTNDRFLATPHRVINRSGQSGMRSRSSWIAITIGEWSVCSHYSYRANATALMTDHQSRIHDVVP